MYSVFIHLLGLSLLEIIFYFYYIGPFEHNVFVAAFGKSIGGLVEKLDSSEEHPYINLNLTSIDNSSLINLKEESNTADIKRETHNYELFCETMHIWLLCIAVLVGFVILHMVYKYFQNRKNISGDDQHIELVSLTNEQDAACENNNLSIQHELHTHYESPYIKVFNYILFSGLLLTFEYLFFHYVILKYHIISDVQIQYLVYSQIYEYITNKYLLN
jgi:hypothetical protein|uniref:Uncharacterized protein n=1 Tax=viral metagenome TaxID=1070528 RepID=A0A6C0IW42_9ZZZZ